MNTTIFISLLAATAKAAFCTKNWVDDKYLGGDEAF